MIDEDLSQQKIIRYYLIYIPKQILMDTNSTKTEGFFRV